MGTAVTCLPNVVIPSQFPLQGVPSPPHQPMPWVSDSLHTQPSCLQQLPPLS